jgi:predicted hotdog family 3-hydroxylacyl-ACP dehydratase
MSFPSIEELLPLRHPSLLLDRVIEADAEAGLFLARVAAGSPFADRDLVPSFVALEVCAQAAGAHQRLGSRAEDGRGLPPVGYLVLVAEARFLVPGFRPDADVRARVMREGVAPPLSLYRFRLEDDQGIVAEGTLGTYVPEPPPSAQTRRPQNH